MIKGSRRDMIMVLGGTDSAFETAYFIMKSGPAVKKCGEEDMLREVSMIIDGCGEAGKTDRRPEPKRSRGKPGTFVLSFLLGLLLGSGAVGLLWLIL